MQLVLLGGKTGAEVDGHDWEYLLTELGWLRFDRTLGLGAHRLGLTMMAGALIWGAIYLARNREQPPEPAADWYGMKRHAGARSPACCPCLFL